MYPWATLVLYLSRYCLTAALGVPMAELPVRATYLDPKQRLCSVVPPLLERVSYRRPLLAEPLFHHP